MRAAQRAVDECLGFGDKARAPTPRETSHMTMPSGAMRSFLLVPALVLLLTGPAAAKPIPGLTEGQTVLLIALALVAIMSAIGAYLIYSGLKNRKLAKASELWPTAGGKVLATEITKRTYRDKNRTTHTFYAPHVRDAYSVGNVDYEGAVIRFGDVEQGHITIAEAITGKYPSAPSSRCATTPRTRDERRSRRNRPEAGKSGPASFSSPFRW
jgi:hypothetical protein